MRTATKATQVIRYDQRNGTKNTPKASKCIMAKGVTPIREMWAPFGRGIDRERAAEAIRRVPLPDFRRSDGAWTECFASADFVEARRYESACSVYGWVWWGSSGTVVQGDAKRHGTDGQMG